ncbi:hypothetical protein [Vibrio cholerae]|uniref:hypothetical protein n=1 Tax=Vibrio cholerae TaxID=666 RepID=UPI00053C5BED|nr:hypothetical protein [Vibrio cholerae]
MAVYKTKHVLLTGGSRDTLLEYYRCLKKSRGKDSEATQAVGRTNGYYYILTGEECREVGTVLDNKFHPKEFNEYWAGEYEFSVPTYREESKIIRLWDTEHFFPHEEDESGISNDFVLLIPPNIGKDWGLDEFVEDFV